MVKFSARDRLKLLAGGAAYLFGGCGGSTSLPVQSGTTVTPQLPPAGGNSPVSGLLRDTFRNNFQIGAALNNQRVTASDLSAQLADDQFSSITPEWELKPDVIQPTPGVYNFSDADRVVDWALDNGLVVRGHALLWHETTPDHFLQGTPTDIRLRLEDYISTVVDYYRDRIQIWDVVNEVVSADIYRGSDGIGPDRRSNWYNAVGSADYIDWAFNAARAANPNAILMLNEYGTETPMKRDWMIEILRRLDTRGVPVDGVGHQFHLNLGSDYQDCLDAIDAVDNEFMGLINHATEIDVSYYNDPGSCWESQTNCEPDLGLNPPTDLLAQHAQLMRDLLNGLALRSTVESVTFWGVRDGDSWLNESPIRRSNHPLLFDRDGEPKPAFLAITDQNYQIPS